MNFIDRQYLLYYEKKRQIAQEHLLGVLRDMEELKCARTLLLEAKRAHSRENVACYKKHNWITLAEAERLIRIVIPANTQLAHHEYEEYGTACATIQRRIANRNAKVRQRTFGSRIA